MTAEPVSCDFTKENFAAKPDLCAPGADEAPEEEFCDNCGRVMVLKNGPWGPFMSCPGYSDDPPCKTIRKLTQKVQSKPPVSWRNLARSAASRCCSATARMASSSRAPGYPKCKYVKQELLDVKCPKDGGDLAVRKTKRGDTFYGCVNYPKCDFSSNLKLVDEQCPSAISRLSAGVLATRKARTWCARTTASSCRNGDRRRARPRRSQHAGVHRTSG